MMREEASTAPIYSAQSFFGWWYLFRFPWGSSRPASLFICKVRWSQIITSRERVCLQQSKMNSPSAISYSRSSSTAQTNRTILPLAELPPDLTPEGGEEKRVAFFEESGSFAKV